MHRCCRPLSILVPAFLAGCGGSTPVSVALPVLDAVPKDAVPDTRGTCPTGLRVRLALRSEVSSLREARSGDRLFVEPDREIIERILRRGRDDDANPHRSVLVRQWLSRRCGRMRGTTRAACDKFFASSVPNLTALLELRNRPILGGLFPTEEERDSPGWLSADTEMLQQWTVNYVGRWIPVLRVMVDNSNGTRNVQALSLIYDVSRAFLPRGDVPDFPPGVFPRYDFDLEFREGEQRMNLAAQRFGELGAPPGKTVTFEVALCPGKDAPNLGGWSGEVILETNQGKCHIGELQLITYNHRAPP